MLTNKQSAMLAEIRERVSRNDEGTFTDDCLDRRTFNALIRKGYIECVHTDHFRTNEMRPDGRGYMSVWHVSSLFKLARGVDPD